jgi:hypothetical protein
MSFLSKGLTGLVCSTSVSGDMASEFALLNRGVVIVDGTDDGEGDRRLALLLLTAILRQDKGI